MFHRVSAVVVFAFRHLSGRFPLGSPAGQVEESHSVVVCVWIHHGAVGPQMGSPLHRVSWFYPKSGDTDRNTLNQAEQQLKHQH